jgi:hypothetical protein
MNQLRSLIKEHLLLEKKIGNILSKLDVVFSFDIARTSHAYERKNRTDISDYNNKEISNAELKYIIDICKREIAESIINGKIKNEVLFIIKSKEKEIAMVINPIHGVNTFWRLLIVTVFRESYDNPFRVGEDQFVIWV